MAEDSEQLELKAFKELTARCVLEGGDVDLQAYIEWWEQLNKRLRFLSPFVDFAWDNIQSKLSVLRYRRQQCDNREAYTTIRNLVAFETGPGPHTPANIFKHTKEGSEAVATMQNGFIFILCFVDLYVTRRDRQSKKQSEIEDAEGKNENQEQGELIDQNMNKKDMNNQDETDIKSKELRDAEGQEGKITDQEQKGIESQEQKNIKNLEQIEIKNVEETKNKEQSNIKSQERGEITDQEQENDAPEKSDTTSRETPEIKDQEKMYVESEKRGEITGEEQRETKNQDESGIRDDKQTDAQSQEQKDIKRPEEGETENIYSSDCCDLRQLLADVYKLTVKDTKWKDAGTAKAAIQALPLTLHPAFILSEAGLEEDVVATVRQMHDSIDDIICSYGIRNKAGQTRYKMT